MLRGEALDTEAAIMGSSGLEDTVGWAVTGQHHSSQ